MQSFSNSFTTTSSNKTSNSLLNFEDSNLYFNFASNNTSATNTTTTTNTISTRKSSNFNKDSNKVFIGGISHLTSDTQFREYFSKYGQLLDSVIIKDPNTNKSKGFGFVQYSDLFMVDELMRNRPHTIDNRQLEIHRSIPRSSSQIRKYDTQTRNVKKLFIGGLNNQLISELDLRTHFQAYGNVIHVQIPKDRETLKFKNFAFITFDDYDPVDKITLNESMMINGLKVSVGRAVEGERAGQDKTIDFSGRSNMGMGMNMRQVPNFQNFGQCDFGQAYNQQYQVSNFGAVQKKRQFNSTPYQRTNRTPYQRWPNMHA